MKYITKPLCLFILLQSSLSFAVEIKLTKDWKIWMTGSNCEEISTEIESITAWKTQLGEPTTKAPDCACVRKKCQVDITDVLPKFAKKVTGIFPENEGPNCFNTSLVASGILPHMRESSAQELSFWLSSPLCHKRGVTEELSAGDILTIRSEFGKKEEHAFIYISKNLAFSKKTNSSDDSYSLLSVDEVLKQYPPSKGCDSFKAGPECKMRVDAFQCATLEQFLKTNPKLGGGDHLIDSVERQEKRLETALFTSVDDFYKPILKTLVPISKLISAKLADASAVDMNSTDVLLMKGLKQRIQSIKEQKEKFDSSK